MNDEKSKSNPSQKRQNAGEYGAFTIINDLSGGFIARYEKKSCITGGNRESG